MTSSTGRSTFLSEGLAFPHHNPVPPVEKASDEFLNKESKLRTALGAVLVQHFQQMAQDDIDDVRRLKAKHLGGAWEEAAKKGSVMGSIVICDDLHVNESAPQPAPAPASPPPTAGGLSGLSKALLAAGGLVLAAGGGAGLTYLATKTPPPVSTTVEKNSGFGLELVPPK